MQQPTAYQAYQAPEVSTLSTSSSAQWGTAPAENIPI